MARSDGGTVDMNQTSSLPILWSFRRCPYAMRARLAIAAAGIAVELREILLRDKPATFLAASAKATVPVLQCAGGRVIDQSRDIMFWALDQHDPDGWLAPVHADRIMSRRFSSGLMGRSRRILTAINMPAASIRTKRLHIAAVAPPPLLVSNSC